MRLTLGLFVMLSIMMPQMVLADRTPFSFLRSGELVNDDSLQHVSDADRELIEEASIIICQKIACDDISEITVVADPDGNSICQVASSDIADRLFVWPVDSGSRMEHKIGCLVYLLTKEVFTDSVPEVCSNPHYAGRVAIGADILKDIAEKATSPTENVKNKLSSLSKSLHRSCVA